MKNLLKNKKTWLIAVLAFGGVATAAKADYVTFTAAPTVTFNGNKVTYDKFEVLIQPKKGVKIKENEYIREGWKNNNSYATVDISNKKVYILNALVNKGQWTYTCKSGYLDNIEDSEKINFEISIPIAGNLDQDHDGIDCTFNGRHLSDN
jgi:hypothetical protein